MGTSQVYQILSVSRKDQRVELKSTIILLSWLDVTNRSLCCLVWEDHELDGDLGVRWYAASVPNVDILDRAEAIVVKAAMPEEPRIGLGRSPDELYRVIVETVEALGHLR